MNSRHIKLLGSIYFLLAVFLLRAENAYVFLETEICYNGIDDNGDGKIDGKDPMCKTIRVTTTMDILDGNVSSVNNLLSDPGPDGNISLREAIAATQSIASKDSFYIIGFDLPNFDPGHFYYQDDGIANQVTITNKVRTTSIDDSAISDRDLDHPRSWFEFMINRELPVLSDNVMIDGFDLRQATRNENPIGGRINTALRIEIIGNGDFALFNIRSAKNNNSQVIIRGLSINHTHEIINITDLNKGNVWINGNHFGLQPGAWASAKSQENIIAIKNSNRPIIIGSNNDNLVEEGEINLIAGVGNQKAGILGENIELLSIRNNYFGVGLTGENDMNEGEGTAIQILGSKDNYFGNNVISFFEVGLDIAQSENDSIQNNFIGTNNSDLSNLGIEQFGGSCHQCKSMVFTKNKIANSRIGWRFSETSESQFVENEVFRNLEVGISLMDEDNGSIGKNENNFIYQNSIHDNLIGVLIGRDANKNALIQNSIFNNGSLGIDLSTAGSDADGITENDANDTDIGPHSLLNYPNLEVTNYTVLTATIKVDLDINDGMATNEVEGYRIEFFANSSPTDRGGKIYVGYLDVTEDANGQEVTIDLPPSVEEEFYISATTTTIKDASFVNLVPRISFFTTSEFSESVPMPKAEICNNGIDDDGDGLADCADPDCENYSTAGSISGAEAFCEAFDAILIENENTPFEDDRTTVFYQWQESTDNGNSWLDISGATDSIYDPSMVNQTTHFRRLVKQHTCNDWLISNEIIKKIKSVPTADLTTFPATQGEQLCAGEAYDFAATDAGEFVEYNWSFGTEASPENVNGKDASTIIFSTPDPQTAYETAVILNVEQDGCQDSDTLTYNIHPLLQIEEVSTTNPTTCGGADGSISVNVIGEMDQCVALSIDGGETYLPDNQLTVNNLTSGAYHLFLKYCTLGCSIDGGIVSLSDPTAIRVNDDEISGSCPGILFKGTVVNNDTLGDNPIFSLAADATYGKITLEDDGKFTYTPLTNSCGLDQFSYRVCNGNTGCCATAVVSVTFGDTEAPTFENRPADLTLGFDDVIPPPAEVKIKDNCPAAQLHFEETDNQAAIGCEHYNYTILRTWTVTDQCGNVDTHIQTIEIVDQTQPDIFRIHTLPNGNRMVAGVMEFTSEHWKTIHLPIQFSETPILFTQLVTDNEATTTTIRMRNITQNQFEIRLQEAEIEDSIHQKESIAWMAIERGTQTEGYQLQVDTVSVTHGWATVSFFQSFQNIPLFFANMQTIRDEDPAAVRNNSVNWNNAKVKIQEENSVDDNNAHTAEAVGYLAMDDIGDLTNRNGETIGETGRRKVTHEWTTITLENSFNNPVVIANSLSNDEFDAATVRVRNVTPTSFEVRVEEWSYLDGNHAAETIGYLVIEGSLPLEARDYCETNLDHVDFTDELIALDNNGAVLEITYEERLGFNGTEQLINRDWKVIDLCENIGVATQVVACPGIAIQAKTILQGALLGNESDGLMRDDLRKAGLIPLVEPYSDITGFEHKGPSGGVLLKEELLDIEGPDAIVDWVFLELRSRINAAHVVATSVGLVQRDGDIVSNKGDSLIVFPSAIHSRYYIAVRHRNHIGMLSNELQELSTDQVPMIDFTNPQTTAFNSGVILEDKEIMWAGDLNQDDRVIYQGPNNDVFYIFLNVLADPLNTKLIDNYVSSTYAIGDVDLDGKVIFQGPDNDRSTLLFNTILLHPENVDFLTNFILKLP